MESAVNSGVDSGDGFWVALCGGFCRASPVEFVVDCVVDSVMDSVVDSVRCAHGRSGHFFKQARGACERDENY